MPTTVLPPRYEVRLEKNVLIPMADGTLIAADLHRPAAPGRFPVVLEYLPYRKDDLMAYRQQRHHYFAQHGFACAWADIRGTGASGGVADDEYTRQEQQDACAIIAWLAEQPWSNGKVGMTGISYGGFNALQVAMLRPPALKAIIPAYATDDRYTDDVHYSAGGALRCYELMDYPLYMVAMNALPPHPEVAGERWAGLWQEHLRNEPWVLRWLDEQVDGPYWRQGSLRPDYGAIEAATLMICGWADCYRNWPLRTYAQLRCPKKVILGPWGHQWPNLAYPGPRIDDLAECIRWFGQWLSDDEIGVSATPPIALYVQSYHQPGPELAEAPGAWRALEDWPPPGTATRSLFLGDGTLHEAAPPGDGRDDLEYLPTVGLCAPVECYGGHSPGLHPLDQRADEAYSLLYTTAPLTEDLEVIGYPLAVLHAAATAQVAFFGVKISDVAPDGRSTLVTRGLLNATRRHGLERPQPLQPGHLYELRVELDCCAWRFDRGHRLRVAIAGSDWPNIWPSPEASTHSIYRGPARPSRLELPVAPAARLAVPEFGPPPELPILAPVEASGGAFEIVESYHEQSVTVHSDSGAYRYLLPHDGTTLADRLSWDVTASRTHPERVSARGKQVYALAWAGGEIGVEAAMTVSSTRQDFHVVIDLSVTVDDAPHAQRQWTRTIPRQLL